MLVYNNILSQDYPLTMENTNAYVTIITKDNTYSIPVEEWPWDKPISRSLLKFCLEKNFKHKTFIKICFNNQELEFRFYIFENTK